MDSENKEIPCPLDSCGTPTKSNENGILNDNLSIKIISSEEQTKQWRQEHICKTDGQRDGSSEKHQRDQVEFITNTECPKTNGVRINHRTLEMKKKRHPIPKGGKPIPDGFDWTEDFDGVQINRNNKLYYNFIKPK